MAPHKDQIITEKSHETANTLEAPKAYSLPGRPYALYSSLPYYFIHLHMLFGYYAIVYLNNPYWSLLLLYLIIPLMDWISHDWLNPDQKQYKELENSIWFKIPVYTQIVLENFLFFKTIHLLTYGDYPLVFQIGTILFMGTTAAQNFLAAHEIFHKHGSFYGNFGTLLMIKNLYMHYSIEHSYGHHKNVGTPGDPSTALYGETYFHFLRRAIVTGYKSAWNIEKKRLTTIYGYKSHWVVQNKMIWYTVSYILFPLLMAKIFGFRGALIYLLLAFLSVATLEVVNYIEHYGLQRKEVAPGEYEKVDVTHSWNAPQRFSNYLLFKLQRHSDHHENAYKPYHVLVSKDESPMLPHGYLWCLVVAFFPNLWFRTMDRVLLAYKEKRSMTQEEQKVIKNDSILVMTLLSVLIIGLLMLNNHAIQSHQMKNI